MKRFAPKIMGILNVTPDSFFEGSRFYDPERAIAQGIKLFQDGADIIDIGGESSRPGSDPVSLEEELARVIPVIKGLRKEISIPISIDTTKPKVAAASLEAGASFINDVSGFRDPEMIALAAQADVPICLMHMLGEPKTMQSNPHYEEGVVSALVRFFTERVKKLTKGGVKIKNIYLDPGIGFGKTTDDNFEILRNLQRFRTLGFPILIGLSRKAFLKNTLNKPTEETLAATIAMNTVALLSNVEIIRVHDVPEHRLSLIHI